MKNLVNERYIFRLIKQDITETLDSFVERLDNQLKKCRFRDPDDQMKDQIIEKCSSNELRKEAFGSELSLKQLILTGRTLEAAEKNCRGDSLMNSKAVLHKDRRNVAKKCNRCGSSDHCYFELQCPALNVKCELCSFVGHYSNMCLSKRKRRSAFEEKEGKSALVGCSQSLDHSQSQFDMKRQKIEAHNSADVNKKATLQNNFAKDSTTSKRPTDSQEDFKSLRA